jgi:hypothetical protein
MMRLDQRHEVGHVVIHLADIVDVAAPPALAMAAHVHRIDGGAVGDQRLRQRVHVGALAARAMDEDDDAFAPARPGAIGERAAVARGEALERRQTALIDAAHIVIDRCQGRRRRGGAESQHAAERQNGHGDNRRDQQDDPLFPAHDGLSPVPLRMWRR